MMRKVFLVFMMLMALNLYAVPKFILNQGYMEDTNGNPVNGVKSITIRIYGSADGDDILFEQVFDVEVKDGFYVVEVDDGAIVPVFDVDKDLYLEISVGNEKGKPRMRIGSVPYAFYASKAYDVVGDIHPRSIYINGTKVIDENGRWVGDSSGIPGVKSITALSPLTGGTITDSGSIGISKADANTDGYLSKEDYAIFYGKQNRVSGYCNVGYCIRQINQDGGVVCEPCSGTGSIKISAGDGIIVTPNPIIGTGSISIDRSYLDNLYVQHGQADSIDSTMIKDNTITSDDIYEIDISKIGSSGCSNGQVIKFNNLSGRWECAYETQYSAGVGLSLAGTTFSLEQIYQSGEAYDSRFVNVGEADSITSAMIVNGTITNADLSTGSYPNITGVGTLGSLTVSGNTYLATTSGNVGIGTTTPLYKLDVNGALRLQPASAPTGAPGLIYYDSAENRFKCYQNGGITNCISNGVATKIVAASDSLNKEKADYICDGTNDEAEINAAINSLPAYGGIVYLLEGTYNTGSPITITKSNVALIGSGKATVLKRMWGEVSADRSGVITVGDGTNAYEGIFISQLQIDGNKAVYSMTYNNGIFFNQKITRSQIKNTWIYNNGGSGIFLFAKVSDNSNSYNIIEGNDVMSNFSGIVLAYTSNNIITGNTIEGNPSGGIYLYFSNDNTITGNTSQGSSSFGGIYVYASNNNAITGNNAHRNSVGINLYSSNNNTITGNTVQANGYGITLSSSINNTITGNTVQGNSYYSIDFYYSSNNTIIGNKISDNGGSDAYDGIRIRSNSDSNLISSNDITDTQGTGYAINIYSSDCDNNYLVGNRYSGPGASSINDLGTGTIYGSQLYGSDLILKPLGNVGIGTTNPTRKLFVNGDAGGTTAWYNDSDERLKTNIQTIDNSLEKVLRLRGVYFEWKDKENRPSGRQVGLIAQEVKEVIPEVVEKKGEYYSIAEANLVAVLVEAIKEQQKEIEELKKRSDYIERIVGEIKHTLSSIANMIERGFMWVRSISNDNKDVRASGITIYDAKNGEPYCIIIEEGKMVNKRGKCSSTL